MIVHRRITLEHPTPVGVTPVSHRNGARGSQKLEDGVLIAANYVVPQ
jgi:hypothetical protein